MKTLLVVASFAIASSGFAQLGTFSQVKIGTPNTFGAGRTLALGINNGVSDYSFTSSNIFLLGSGNYVYSDIYTSENLFILGTSNGVDYSSNSIFIGSAHYANDGFNASIVAGVANNVDSGNSSLVVGGNNEAYAFSYGAMIGYGLICSDWNYASSNSVIIGKYNSIDGYTGTPGRLLTVGNGTTSNARSNALVVYDNGDVIIPKRQGDILMGEFGN
jgi:hypothetical protein